MAHSGPRSALVVLLATAALVVSGYALGSGPSPPSSSNATQIGKILSVRKVLRTLYFVSRYPQVHYYVLYISLRISDQNYCSEYETPVLDEIEDVLSANGEIVEVVFKGKRIAIRTRKGRKLKTRLVGAKDC